MFYYRYVAIYLFSLVYQPMILYNWSLLRGAIFAKSGSIISSVKNSIAKKCIFYTYIATDSEVTKKLYRKKKKRLILFQNRKTPTEKNSSTVICFFPDGCLEDVSCCF